MIGEGYIRVAELSSRLTSNSRVSGGIMAMLGPLPDGPLADARVILAPPRWSRWFRTRLTASWALVRAVRANWPEVVAAIRRDQSVNKRLEPLMG